MFLKLEFCIKLRMKAFKSENWNKYSLSFRTIVFPVTYLQADQAAQQTRIPDLQRATSDKEKFKTKKISWKMCEQRDCNLQHCIGPMLCRQDAQCIGLAIIELWFIYLAKGDDVIILHLLDSAEPP